MRLYLFLLGRSVFVRVGFKERRLTPLSLLGAFGQAHAVRCIIVSECSLRSYGFSEFARHLKLGESINISLASMFYQWLSVWTRCIFTRLLTVREKLASRIEGARHPQDVATKGV